MTTCDCGRPAQIFLNETPLCKECYGAVDFDGERPILPRQQSKKSTKPQEKS